MDVQALFVFWPEIPLPKVLCERCTVLVQYLLVFPKIWSLFDECTSTNIPKTEGRKHDCMFWRKKFTIDNFFGIRKADQRGFDLHFSHSHFFQSWRS
jgi:hypothetical protein